MGVRSGSKRKRRRAASAGGADRISGLGDDVLVRILELLPDAGDAVRTGVLSRRWRGLWTRLRSLTFDSSRRRRKLKAGSSDERFLAFVDKALAQRAMTDAALEHLAISFAITSPVDQHAAKWLVPRSADAAQEWVRCAVHNNAVKSLVLKLQLFPNRRRNVRDDRQHRPTMNLSQLGGSVQLKTMHWKLSGVRLQLPAAAVFTSLVDLSLEDIEFAAGSDHLLARFLSSACCPSLQKLRLSKFSIPNLKELLIEASALIELSLSCGPPIQYSWELRLKTPSLRFFRIQEDYTNLRTLGISAPRLEELTIWPYQVDHLVVDGELPCLRSLKVELDSHGDEYNYINNNNICLLRCCTSLTCLEVDLHVDIDEEDDDIISGRIPQLPHLISLTVRVYLLELHSFGIGLAEILKQCNYIKYLHVHCSDQTGRRDVNNSCNHPDQWKYHQMYLANIQGVHFTGLVGTDCERWFIQRVLEHATQLQKVILSFDPRLKLHNIIDVSRFIPCNGGAWVCHDPLSYEWNYDSIHK